MEFIAGETLRELLERERLRQEDVLRYVTQIAEALAEAHRCGLCRLDVTRNVTRASFERSASVTV